MSVLHSNGESSESVPMPKTQAAPLISEAYVLQNLKLHELQEGYGTSGQMWARYVERLVTEEKYKTILDYGCGKGTLAKALPNIAIAEYDPCVPGKEARPSPAELVVCTDVLEHIEPELLENVLADLAYLTQKKLFFNIALRPAVKTLPDGRNAHLILQPAQWWFERIRQHFTVTLWEARDGKLVYGEAFPGAILRPTAGGYKRRNREERRRVEAGTRQIVDLVKAAGQRYGDALSQVKTDAQWEPWDDVYADLLVCGGVLQALNPVPGPQGSELQRAMSELCARARIGVVLVIPMDKFRGEGWWKEFLGKYVLFSDWAVANGCVYCIGCPHTRVQGVKTIMGTKDEQLWQHIAANVERIKGRIAPAEPHERRAILACYGPSLGDYLFKLVEERAQPDTVLVSVSGAHDFLLAHGVTPDIHVECDPRPHKADNIEHGVAGVQYQIASVVHERVFEKLAGFDVRLWHVSMQDFMIPLVDRYKENPRTIISGGGSVGLRSLPLLYAQGFRKFSVYAMDCSFADDGRQQWAGKHAGKRQDVTTCEVGGRVFYTSPVLMTYAANMMDEMRKMEGCEFRIYGDGLLPAMVRFNGGADDELIAPPQGSMANG